MKINFNYKAIFIILSASVLLGIIYNTFSSSGIDFIRKEIKIEFLDIGDSENSGNLKGIKLSQVLELYNSKSAIFVDARDQWDFSENHITGAINIPEFSFDENEFMQINIPKESVLVIYCDGDDCDTSKRLAIQISKLGYKDIYVFLDGIKTWIESKLPISNVKK